MTTFAINRRQLFLQSWATAHYHATRKGGTARSHFAAALKLCWAKQKALAPEINAMLGRVQVEADKITAAVRAAGARPSIYRTHWQGTFTATAAYAEREGLRA